MIVVLDFGSDTNIADTSDVARFIRSKGVYSEIVPYLSQSYAGKKVAGVVYPFVEESAAEGKVATELKGIPSFRTNSAASDALSAFVAKLSGGVKSWTPQAFLDKQIDAIRKQVGDKRVLCALSGGVDSTVTGAIIHKAIGSQLTCIFVDTGLMRHNEGASVTAIFKDIFGDNFIAVNAEDRFLTALKGVSEPEKKRKIIGEQFIRVFEDEARKLGKFDFLAQGTIYPDVVESVSADGSGLAVKSHHNVGGLPKDMQFALVEPLRELYKDEVRELGKLLGISSDLIQRHPFPGPGIGVRILGEVTKAKCDKLRHADHIFIEELRSAGLYNTVWQAFCALLDVKAVGVKNGKRTYNDVIAIRAVNGVNGMSAVWSKLPYPLLERVSDRILNEVDGVSRVVYDISSKPPATIEWE